MKALAEMLQDNSGGTSSMRIIFFAWNLAVLIVWVAQCLTAHPIALQPIDTTTLELVLGMAGMKAIQRFGEKPEPSAPSPISVTTQPSSSP